jgi:thiamine-phosphate pyrophosphorylase
LGGVIALTGATDRLSDGARLLRITNGDPLMARVTAMGCAGAAFSAACLAVEGDRFKAAAAALLAFAVAGEVAGARARGPGSLAVEIVDALYARPRHLARASEGDMTKVDVRLNAILDPERAGGHDLAELARLVAEGGATLVQLRDKQSDTRVMIERARAIKAALAPFKVPLVINDRVDVALVAEADGVHVGQTDMPVEDARRLLPPGAIIGLSINSVERAQAAPIELLDYVGIGGVYATTSKTTKNAPIGIAGLARIANAFHMRAPLFPLCAIAGIDAGNAADTIVAGADGVAVISALSLAADPRAATRELRKVVDTALGRRVRA